MTVNTEKGVRKMFVKIRDNRYINPDMYSMVWIRDDEVCFESQQGIFSIGVGDLGSSQFDEFRQRMIDYFDRQKGE